MLRRQYFLFPDVAKAKCAVEDLKEAGIPPTAMHALANSNIDLDPLPRAGERQPRDICCTVEKILCRAYYLVFTVGLIGLIYSLWLPSTVWAIVFTTIMMVSFVFGERYARIIPRAHLNEFKDALSYGEILLAIDLPKEKVHSISQMMSRQHPDAVRGGSSWTLPILEQ